ncbi:MAG TPA: MFS transporter [Steroidobacteraceae bacterium]|nr:MFS transporter [Steroidobacteraceae bacterium]
MAGRPRRAESPTAEAAFRREIASWALLGLTLGLVEGATAAVLIKKTFMHAASPWFVNLAVAFVSGAPALSNVVSFVWANLAHGRARIGLMVGLQAGFAILVGLLGVAPHALGGLAFAVASILIARVVWTGILTVRAAVWSANYPRAAIGRYTGRIVIVSSLAVAVAAATAAWVLDQGVIDSRWLFGGGAVAGLIAAWLYRAARVRREFALLAEENAVIGRSEPFSLGMLFEILKKDPHFREYMFWMGVFGGGNLMLTSQLVVIFSEHLHLSASAQIALLSIVPLGLLPLFVPFWARMFDRGHVVEYRARQGWALVAAVALLTVGTWIAWLPLLWFGAVVLAFAYAGSNLGWNLGHNDFASVGRAQHYMGVHVTLTGVRGAIGPPAGILIYQWLESLRPGFGLYSLVLPLAFVTAGAAGFSHMRRVMRSQSVNS